MSGPTDRFLELCLEYESRSSAPSTPKCGGVPEPAPLTPRTEERVHEPTTLSLKRALHLDSTASSDALRVSTSSSTAACTEDTCSDRMSVSSCSSTEAHAPTGAVVSPAASSGTSPDAAVPAPVWRACHARKDSVRSLPPLSGAGGAIGAAAAEWVKQRLGGGGAAACGSPPCVERRASTDSWADRSSGQGDDSSDDELPLLPWGPAAEAAARSQLSQTAGPTIKLVEMAETGERSRPSRPVVPPQCGAEPSRHPPTKGGNSRARRGGAPDDGAMRLEEAEALRPRRVGWRNVA